MPNENLNLDQERLGVPWSSAADGLQTLSSTGPQAAAALQAVGTAVEYLGRRLSVLTGIADATQRSLSELVSTVRQLGAGSGSGNTQNVGTDARWTNSGAGGTRGPQLIMAQQGTAHKRSADTQAEDPTKAARAKAYNAWVDINWPDADTGYICVQKTGKYTRIVGGKEAEQYAKAFASGRTQTSLETLQQMGAKRLTLEQLRIGDYLFLDRKDGDNGGPDGHTAVFLGWDNGDMLMGGNRDGGVYRLKRKGNSFQGSSEKKRKLWLEFQDPATPYERQMGVFAIENPYTPTRRTGPAQAEPAAPQAAPKAQPEEQRTPNDAVDVQIGRSPQNGAAPHYGGTDLDAAVARLLAVLQAQVMAVHAPGHALNMLATGDGPNPVSAPSGVVQTFYRPAGTGSGAHWPGWTGLTAPTAFAPPADGSQADFADPAQLHLVLDTTLQVLGEFALQLRAAVPQVAVTVTGFFAELIARVRLSVQALLQGAAPVTEPTSDSNILYAAGLKAAAQTKRGTAGARGVSATTEMWEHEAVAAGYDLSRAKLVGQDCSSGACYRRVRFGTDGSTGSDAGCSCSGAEGQTVASSVTAGGQLLSSAFELAAAYIEGGATGVRQALGQLAAQFVSQLIPGPLGAGLGRILGALLNRRRRARSVQEVEVINPIRVIPDNLNYTLAANPASRLFGQRAFATGASYAQPTARVQIDIAPGAQKVVTAMVVNELAWANQVGGVR